ncbi:hypothetical protein ACHAWX_004883 [Stephanocyclus meneghinianus]
MHHIEEAQATTDIIRFMTLYQTAICVLASTLYNLICVSVLLFKQVEVEAAHEISHMFGLWAKLMVTGDAIQQMYEDIQVNQAYYHVMVNLHEIL